MAVIAPGHAVASGSFGGANSIIDSTGEADSFIAAFRSAATDGDALALYNSQTTTERDVVDQRIRTYLSGSTMYKIVGGGYFYAYGGPMNPVASSAAAEADAVIGAYHAAPADSGAAALYDGLVSADRDYVDLRGLESIPDWGWAARTRGPELYFVKRPAGATPIKAHIISWEAGAAANLVFQMTYPVVVTPGALSRVAEVDSIRTDNHISWFWGGDNQRVDTVAEADVVIDQIRSAPEYGGTSIWNGLNDTYPSDRWHVQQTFDAKWHFSRVFGGNNWKIGLETELDAFITALRGSDEAATVASNSLNRMAPADRDAAAARMNALGWSSSRAFGGANWKVDTPAEANGFFSAARASGWEGGALNLAGALHPVDHEQLGILWYQVYGGPGGGPWSPDPTGDPETWTNTGDPLGIKSYLLKLAIRVLATAIRVGGDEASVILKYLKPEATATFRKHHRAIANKLDDIADEVDGSTKGPRSTSSYER